MPVAAVNEHRQPVSRQDEVGPEPPDTTLEPESKPQGVHRLTQTHLRSGVPCASTTQVGACSGRGPTSPVAASGSGLSGSGLGGADHTVRLTTDQPDPNTPVQLRSDPERAGDRSGT